jgi:hypothetical protein
MALVWHGDAALREIKSLRGAGLRRAARHLVNAVRKLISKPGGCASASQIKKARSALKRGKARK